MRSRIFGCAWWLAIVAAAACGGGGDSSDGGPEADVPADTAEDVPGETPAEADRADVPGEAEVVDDVPGDGEPEVPADVPTDTAEAEDDAPGETVETTDTVDEVPETTDTADVAETPECSTSPECDDLEPCNGAETCAGGACVDGVPPAEGAGCTTAAGAAGFCRSGACTGIACGNGFVETGEACDDGDLDDTDGCLSTCVAATCGDGFVWAGTEACDDGNAVTEWCGTGTACAGACALLESSCGNGRVDPGEACDDGDTDSMDDCTTSCTVNDHGIGAPCTCTGSRCSSTDFTVGTLTGCGGVTIPAGTGGVLGCMRSIREATSGTETYYAEGYCVIMAVRCEGGLCGFVPQPGTFATVACPAGSYLYEDSRSVMGMTITSRTCLEICTTDTDCRWNANDAFRSACGHYGCLALAGVPAGTTLCGDERQY